MQPSLTSIANKYGTDKGTIGPSAKWQVHNYTDIYEPYLMNLRNREINFLEVGLGVTGANWEAKIAHGRNEGGGASIKMWYEYFPKARIFGADINECAYLDNDRIKTYVVDQGDADSLNNFLEQAGNPEFDVIIDDGSHIPEHQQITFSLLFKHLKSGGLYFIEDLRSNGIKDNESGRMSSDKYLNTRSIFKEFIETGNFPDPNALSDIDYIKSHTDIVRLHAPVIGRRKFLSKNIFAPVAKVPYTIQDTERICMIRKK